MRRPRGWRFAFWAGFLRIKKRQPMQVGAFFIFGALVGPGTDVKGNTDA